MILSDRDIAWYIEKGLLRIEPLSGDTIRENGVDLRLGDEVCRLRNNVTIPGELDTASMDNLEDFYVCRSGLDRIRINPHERVLATTMEYVCLPDDLVGLVNLRSTLARTGLSIPPTIIDAGFCGQVTIEIIGSSFPVVLYPGQRFLHVVFVKTTSPVASPYSSKYQGQRGVTLPRPDRR